MISGSPKLENFNLQSESVCRIIGVIRKKGVNQNMGVKITLRAARNNLVLTRKQAAKLFNIHYETLTKYEYDSTNVPISFFNKIEEAYGIPLDFIFIGNEREYVKSMKDRLRLRQEV